MDQPLLPRARVEVAPGAVHVPDWLSVAEQRHLVEAAREWARPPAGLHRVRLRGGAEMSVRMVGLGWHWAPYRYTRTAHDVDGAPVKPLPDWLADLGRRAVADAYPEGADDDDADGEEFLPDVALVNHYDATARMGLHQDRDEVSRAPVVSLSVGDACVFRFGNTRTRTRPWVDVELRSGDLFVFGGPSRLAFHGVPKVLAGTADPACGLSRGRLNVTIRETGLALPRSG